MGWGIGQHLRFAAAEVAAPDGRTRAISLVMAGGVLAAIIGPELVKRTNMLVPPLAFLGTYACLTMLPVHRRDPAAVHQGAASRRVPRAPPVPLRAILARPNFITAVVCSMVGYGTMNLVMASTPVEMMFCGFGIGASADVIRAHSIAMFLPGFVTGRLIQRFGVHRIILAGGVLTLLCVAINVAFAPAYATFMVALMLSGCRLELHVRRRHHTADHRLCAGRAGARAGDQRLHRVRHAWRARRSSSGAVQATVGWAALNLTVVPPVFVAVALIAWHWMGRSRLAPASV